MKVSSAAFAAVLSLGVLGTGCTDAPEVESVGRVEVPLIATGLDGSVYRLPFNTFLFLSGSPFFGSYSMNGETRLFTLVVPPGDYSVSLSHSSGYTAVWPLEREKPDGTIETVSGTLDLTPSITVAENQVTPLVIRFEVAGILPITFSTGSVDVTLDVDGTPSPSLTFRVAATDLTVNDVSPGDETVPAALLARLPTAGTSGDQYVITMRTIGPWTFSNQDRVCARVAATHEVSGHPGFVNLIAEAPPSEFDQICISQFQQFAFVSTGVNRFGAATTELLADFEFDEYFINHNVTMQFEGEVFDGRTLHLDRLAGARVANAFLGASLGVFIQTEMLREFHVWPSLSLSGSGTVTLTAD